MTHALALWFSLTAGLDDVREWRHLPDEKTCAENYHAAVRYVNRCYQCWDEGTPWEKLAGEINDGGRLRDYWYAAWWVRWPKATAADRRLHFANMRAFERELAAHLPHGQTPPALPVWRWERP